MKIVITGHNSLLGSNLAKYFSVNNQVILLGTRNKKYKKYQFNYEYNYLDLNNLNVFFNNEKNIDLFIHCAGINSKVCYENSEEAFKFNVKFTTKIWPSIRVFHTLITLILAVSINKISKLGNPWQNQKYVSH